ncbi:uncharacterized protein HMPREF1541_01732 [Cyphellophora europaea CBS 101466]|uniref:Transcription factor domain-containing protein n=1 Tax=Cyphellophora europaea (strain CBS 101466) TaxID=1220924 RepID=W2S1W8_CYPE1|nr:uncharacterized protein HMPREF1541_01732 [Cyphellophora europaea CBS 101466]ETN42575.1 hypothetical protein HMPREF1541_01732 [Cyphellophora europaea CBS 101466]
MLTKIDIAPGLDVRLGSLDPFTSLGYTIDADTANLLHYFHTTWAQTAFQSATNGNDVQRVRQSEASQVIQQVMGDKLVAPAFLAAIGMRVTALHSTVSTAERHAASALCQLRSSLDRESASNEQLLLSILFLAAYETYCFNLEGTRTHLRALRRLNAQRHLTGYLKALCRNVDLFSASSLLKPPIFPIPTTIPTPVPEHLTVGHGFLNYSDVLGLGMNSILRSIISCGNVAEEFKLRQGAEEHMRFDLLQIVAWSESLTYQLLEQMPGTPVKECCIIALLMWLSYLPAAMMGSKDGSSLAPSKSFLKMIPGRGTGLVNRLKASTLDSYLHLWILAVGIVCAVDQDDTRYCAVEFVQLAYRLDVSDVRHCFRQFLWLDNFDLIDYDVMMQLLDHETSQQALQTAVSWAAKTKGQSSRSVEEKQSSVRVTNRPSNGYRLGG